jgi:replicative DNA helicase
LPQSLDVVVQENFSSDLIFDDSIREIYDWQLSYIRKYGKAASKELLCDQFSEYNLVLVPPKSNILDLLERLRKRYAIIETQRVLNAISREVVDNPLLAARKLVDEGRSLASKISSRKELFERKDIDKALDRYARRVERGRGPSFGFEEIDEFYYGQELLTFLVAAPKIGKSWVTINSALKNIENGLTVVIFPLELPAETTDFRLRCMAADIPFWKYLHGQLSDTDIKMLKRKSEQLSGSYLVEKPARDHRSIYALYQTALEYEADVIYIDQLQYIENRNGRSLGSTNDTKDFFDVVDSLKDLCDEHSVPVWMVHQFNREARTDEFPIMQNIKSSASIEECATLVLGLHSNREMRKSKIIQIGTLASRNYGHNRWDLKMEMVNGCNFKLIGESQE